MKPDPKTLVERSHTVAMLAIDLETPDSGWPDEGARADVERVRVARRLAWAKWLAETGVIDDER